MKPVTAYIRRETLVSVIINSAFSLVFFGLVFGFRRQVTVWGVGGYVFDFGPQAFMIALMATLVPGTIARRAVSAGRMAPWPTRLPLPHTLWLTALLLALGSAAVAVGCATATLALIGRTQLAPAAALAAKLLFGAALAAIITPIGLRVALRPGKCPL